MVDVKQLLAQDKGRVQLRKNCSVDPFELIKSYSPAKKSLRKFPFLIACHRATDGALIGVLFAVTIVSGIALHAQYLWSASYAKLEVTRDLSQRLMESTAILERHLIKSSSKAKLLVPTKSKHLVYLIAPSKNKSYKPKLENESESIFQRLASYPSTYGY